MPLGGEIRDEDNPKSHTADDGVPEAKARMRLCPRFHRKGCHAAFYLCTDQLLQQLDSEKSQLVLRWSVCR